MSNLHTPLPVGKLPIELLTRLIAHAPQPDPRVILGPGVGLDCAVVDAGPRYIVFKSDPITFATDEIGWYAVQINANDIATTGATPRWFLATLLLPEGKATYVQAETITAQVYNACQEIGVAVIGGHTEVTYGLDRPILIGTLVGEVERDALITPLGAQPGDRLLLTKGVPIEATAIVARELPHKLEGILTDEELDTARNFIYRPGISVLRDAQTAVMAGKVHAMHDPTEGGLAGALWEMSEACGHPLFIDPAAVPMPELSARICRALGLNPLATIASGALLMAVPPEQSERVILMLEGEGITCAEIGHVEAASEGGVAAPAVHRPGANGPELLPRPQQDEIARLFAKP